MHSGEILFDLLTWWDVVHGQAQKTSTGLGVCWKESVSATTQKETKRTVVIQCWPREGIKALVALKGQVLFGCCKLFWFSVLAGNQLIIWDVTYKSLSKAPWLPHPTVILLELIKIFGFFPSLQYDRKIIFKTYNKQRNKVGYWPPGYLWTEFQILPCFLPCPAQLWVLCGLTGILWACPCMEPDTLWWCSEWVNVEVPPPSVWIAALLFSQGLCSQAGYGDVQPSSVTNRLMRPNGLSFVGESQKQSILKRWV